MSKNYLICLFFAGLMAQVSTAQPVQLSVGSVSLDCTGGQVITVPVSMANGTNITACQFTLQWDPTVLQFVPGSGTLQGAFTTPSVSPNFGEGQTNTGKLIYAWIDNPGVTTGAGGMVMFTIQFNVLSVAATSINITGSPTLIKVGAGGPPANQQFTLTAGAITTGDTEPPILVCPADQTVMSDNPLIVNNLTPFVSDNCALNSLDYTLSGTINVMGMGDASGQDNFPLGTTFLQYTAIDDAGNQETCTSSVTVNPDTLTIIAQSRTGDCNEPLYIDILVDNFDAVSTLGFTLNWDKTVLQFESVGLLEDSLINVAAADIGTFQLANGKLTFAWYDAANHSAPDQTRLFRIYFKAIGATGAATALSFSSNPTPQIAGSGAPAPALIPAIWQNGTAQIIDATPPTITCPANQTINNVPSFPLTVNGLYPAVADNCAVDVVNYQLSVATVGQGIMPANGSLDFNEGTTTVTQTVTDMGGNQAQCQFTVTLTGTAKPKFILPTVSAECKTGQFSIDMTVTDFKNVASLNLALGFNNTVLKIESIEGYNPATLPTFNWLATFSNANGTINIDFVNTPPSSGVTLIDGETLLKIFVTPIGTAGATSLFNFAQPPAASSPNGPYQTLSQDGFVSIVDTKGPAIDLCPGDILVGVDSTNCFALANWTLPTALDACDGSAITFVSDIKIGDTLTVAGSPYAVHYTATDNSGNKSFCNFNINVIDDVFPKLKCPANDTLGFDAGQCTVTINSLPQPISFSDNCTASPTLIPPQVSLPQTLTAGQSLNVEYLVVDDAGNPTVCNFFLVAPAVGAPPSNPFCPTAQTVSCDAVVAFNLPLPTFLPGCGPALTFSVFPLDTSNFVIGTTPVTFTASNSNGQSATCTFNIIVKDTQKPTISNCPTNDTLTTSGTCTVAMPLYSVDVMDNCDAIVNVEYEPFDPGQQLPIGTTDISVIATDDSGNADTCTFKITVVAGQIAALINCPPDSTYQNVCIQAASWTDPTPVGFCGTPVIVESNPSNNVFLTAGLADTISFTATDMAGNVATCSFILMATDTVAPVLTCPPSITVDVAGNIISDLGQYITSADTVAGCDAVQLFFGVPDSDDNCSGTNFQPNTGPTSGMPFPLGTSEIYWRAMDASGNIAECIINVTVVPLDTPSIIGLPDPACLGDLVNLSSNINALGTTYSWTAPNGFTSTNPTAVIFGLTNATAGPYSLNTSVNGCPTPQTAPFTAVLAQKPKLTDDNYTIPLATTLDSFSVIENDQLTAGDSYSVTLQTPPSDGVLVNHGKGIFTYTAPGTAVGGTSFGYLVCSETCPGLCDTAVVFIEVTRDPPCDIIPKVITPNGDGLNDEWIIFCLQSGLFPNNSLIVFNQWGDKVYEAAPYDQSWEGTLNGEAGKDLPDGTYYYIFKPSPADVPIKGFLTIFR